MSAGHLRPAIAGLVALALVAEEGDKASCDKATRRAPFSVHVDVHTAY